MRSFAGPLLILAFACSSSLILYSQEAPAAQPQAQPTLPDAPQPKATASTQNPAAKTEEEKAIEHEEQSQRILGVVPQFGMTSRLDAPALSSGEKFHLFAKSAFDPAILAIEGLQAGISQAENEFPGYGQGAQGYGKRYGASFADEVSSNFFANYFYSVLLREDPRYFRLGQGSIKHRIWYSLAQEFVCHTDKGGRDIAWENILGAFSSGGLSNAYYPSTDRGFGLTMSRSAIALAYGSAGGLVDEFWVDINHKLFHNHRQKIPAH